MLGYSTGRHTKYSYFGLVPYVFEMDDVSNVKYVIFGLSRVLKLSSAWSLSQKIFCYGFPIVRGLTVNILELRMFSVKFF